VRLIRRSDVGLRAPKLAPNHPASNAGTLGPAASDFKRVMARYDDLHGVLTGHANYGRQ